MTNVDVILIEIHQCLLAFYCEDTVDLRTVHCWVRKLSNGGGNVDGKDRACHRTNYVNRQKDEALIPPYP